MTSQTGSLCRSDDGILDQLLEEVTHRIQSGELVDADAYVAAHPNHAESLRRLLPAMQALVVFGHSQSESARGRSASVIPAQLESGVLGDFRIIREIGRGGMGVVYEAEQISIGRPVALKVLPFAAMLDERHLARFRNEVRAAGQLHHSNIVPVYVVGCERGVHYYAMQLVDGQSLADLVADLRRARQQSKTNLDAAPATPSNKSDTAQSRASREASVSAGTETVRMALSTLATGHGPTFYRTAAQLGVQAADALEHAHANGVVHRDIKPSNLIVDLHSRLWITDFGLAHIESDDNLTMTGDLLGTLRYMSPEQTRGSRVVLDHRTDIYSLGVTLYELLALKPAFDGPDRQQLLQQITHDEPKSLRHIDTAIPVDLETIIGKAMAKDAVQRYATAADLAADLRRFLAHEQISARPPSLLDRGRKWLRRHAAVVRVGLAALTLLAVSGTVAALLTFSAYRSEARQRAVAEANLLLAAESVDRLLARVAGTRHNHGDLSEAEKLTADGTELYEQLLSTSGNPELVLRAARAYGQVARIQAALFQAAEVERAQARAVELLTPLTKAFPNRANYLDALAEASLCHGEALFSLGRNAAAETPFRQALAICEQLTEQYPQEGLYQHRLTHALLDLGMWHSAAGQAKEAEALYRREAEVGLRLPSRISELPESQSLQALALHNFAQLACEQGDYDRAIRALREAINLQGCAHLGWPTNASFVDRLNGHHIRLAEAFLEARRPQEAATAVEQMITALPERLQAYHEGARLLVQCALVATGSPNDEAAVSKSETQATPALSEEAYRQRARQLLNQTATARIRSAWDIDRFARFLLSCPDESFRDAKRALELSESVVQKVPERAAFWFTKALAHFRLGDLQQADFELTKVITYAPDEQASASNLLLLALLRARQGNDEEARNAYAEAQLRMRPGSDADEVVTALTADVERELSIDADHATP